MMETVLQTGDVPIEERFGYWRELVSSSFAPTEWSSDQARRFRVRQRMLELGGVEVWEAAFSSSALMRATNLIRRSDPEKCCIAITRRGALLGDTAGQRVVCEVGDLHCHDTSHPRENAFHPPKGQELYQGISIMFSKADLPLPRNKIDRVVGTRVRRGDGVGALLTAFVTQLTEHTDSFRRTDGGRLELVVIDLISAMFAEILDDLDSLPATSHRNALALRIKKFIVHHLSDPQLTPSEVAAAHHISVSYLHRLFQDEDATVAEWIRRRRLERARGYLADPERSAPVHAIATRCGFLRAADFTRAFRNAYGMPPTEYRSKALHSRG